MQTGCMGYFVLILINLRGYMSCMYAYLLKSLLWVGFFLYYKYIFIHHTHLASLSATRKDLWLPELIIKCLVADASFGNTSQRKQPKLDKGSLQKKKQDISWHWAKFIWHLPTLPNYNIKYLWHFSIFRHLMQKV